MENQVMENQANAFLGTESISRLIRRFAVPCVISLLIGAIYNMTDQVFIGWGVGYLGNGATNVVFPLTVLALALATMIGDGACTFVSLSLGRKDQESARRTVGSAVMLSILVSLLLTLIYAVFQMPLLAMFGATPANLAYAREYFTVITIGIPFYMFGQALNPIIRSDGSPRLAMMSTLAGALINVILDPIAIFVLGWGMKGAALATMFGQIVTAVIAAVYLGRMKNMQLCRKDLKLTPKLLKSYLPLGFCSFLSQGALVISFAFTNMMLVQIGGQSVIGADIPLTVLGIVGKFLQIVIAVAVGLAAGCIPIVGYNYGAGLTERTRQLLKWLVLLEALTGGIALILFEVFPMALIQLFGQESKAYLDFAVRAFRIYLGLIPLACINKGTFIFMQSMGRPVLSTLLSFFREVVLSVPLVVLMPLQMGLDGILYSMPLSDLIAFAVSAVILILTYRQLRQNSPTQVAFCQQEGEKS